MKKILLLLTTLLVNFTGFGQKDYTIVYNNDSIIKRGIALHDKEKYVDAIAEYDKINALDPQFLKAQFEKALSLSKAEKKSEVKLLFENLYSGNKMQDEPDFYTLYGSFLSDTKEYVLADKIFTEGEKFLPNSSNFLYNKAILHIRKEEQQKAIDILKKVIIGNPNYPSAHYFLGILALENGKITEGTLALLSYLMIAPTGRYAEDAILKLNKKFGENFLEKNKYVFSKTGDNFEEFEVILRNQLPLKPAYKVKSEIDDVIIRQVQALSDYSLEHKIQDGFFETTYLPWLRDLSEKKQFEGFSYYILLGMEEKLGKKLTSQKKKINNFYDDYYSKNFWNIFSLRKQEHFGKTEDVKITFNKNIPQYVGTYTNNVMDGKFKLLDADGNLSAELFVKKDALEGIQKYVDKKGTITSTKNFKEGKLDGLTTSFYKNGNIEIESEYKDDKYNGVSKSYHENGGKNCEVSFVNDERDGKMICMFENGIIKTETNYTLGKLNGPYKEYNEVGDLIETYNYKNGELDGKYFVYYDSKLIKNEAEYSNGKVQGSFKKYYSNGVLEQENKFVNGKIKTATYYNATAKKSAEAIYDDKEEMESYSYFDADEKKYFEEKYRSGELKTGLQYSNIDQKPVEINLTKKTFEIKNLDGSVRVTGEFEKGKKVNEWKFYNESGVLKEKNLYKKGKLNGVSQVYNKRGLLTKILNYVDDEVSGVYEGYENGVLTNSYNYEKDKPNGPYKILTPEGKISTQGYLINNDLNYTRESFWPNGNLSSSEKFNDDTLLEYSYFTTKGTKENTIIYKNRTGNFTDKFYDGTTIVNCEMKNGLRNGPYLAKDASGNKLVELNYRNGLKHGAYTMYGPLGAVQSTYNYYCGKINGKSSENDLVGNLRITDEYKFGDEYGITTRYYHNKAKIFDYTQINDIREGNYTYYNLKGEPLLIVGYQDNIAKYYIIKNKTGELIDKIPLKKETASIVSSYPNGKKAVEINFNKGNIEGLFAIYSQEGKPLYTANYTNDLLNGERVEYYENGKIYKKEKFINANFDGLQEYYKEDGSKWLFANFKNDELQGNVEIYTNGKLTLTKKYESDELVQIIK